MAAAGKAALIASLQRRREAITLELAAGPGQTITLSDGTAVTTWRPTYTADGETQQYLEYKQGLYDELDRIEKLIQQYSSPFIVRTRGRA